MCFIFTWKFLLENKFVFLFLGRWNSSRSSKVPHSQRISACTTSDIYCSCHYRCGYFGIMNFCLLCFLPFPSLLCLVWDSHPYNLLQESVGIAKALAAKNGYELDSNQEVNSNPESLFVLPYCIRKYKTVTYGYEIQSTGILVTIISGLFWAIATSRFDKSWLDVWFNHSTSFIS